MTTTLHDEFNREAINPSGCVAQVFPPEHRDALVFAGRYGDIGAIDKINAELVAKGWCRPPSSQTLRNAVRGGQ